MKRNQRFQQLFDRFNQVQFDAESHTYQLNDKALMSVTKWVSTHEKPFDKYVIAAKMAQSSDKPMSYYTAYWKMLGDEAAALGNRVHHFAAWYSKGDKCRDKREEAVAQFIDDYTDNGWEMVATELIVHNEEFAGCIDRLMYHSELDKYMIVDFKTTEKDMYEVKGRLSNGTPNSLYNKYSMQLKKYNEILGLDAEMIIVQITDDYRTFKV